VIAGTRLRGGNASSARGAASMITEAVATARASRKAGAHFSVTVRTDPKVRAANPAISGDAWTPVRYPRAVWDDQLRRWVSDAEVAEVEYTAFASRGQAVTARLIVRRIKDLSRTVAEGKGELFTAWRYHAVSTDSPFVMLQAEEHHRGHAQASRSSPTGPMAPSRTCRRDPSPRTPPGSPSPPSAATCCARPAPWPASLPPAARQQQRPDQPRPGHRPPTAISPRQTATTPLPPEPPDKPQTSKRQENHAPANPEISPRKPAARNRSPKFTRWIEAKNLA